MATARLSRTTDAPELLVLDDAYQHLQAARDLNVLLVDAQTGFGNRRMLPLGPLREPIGELRRADVVLITKANLGAPDAVTAQVRRLGTTVPIFQCDYAAKRLQRLDGKESLSLDVLAGKRVSLLCGIARPDAFRASVTQLGATIMHVEERPDHHGYPAADLARLADQISSSGSNIAGNSIDRWLTTEKDAVKLRDRLSLDAQAQLWVLVMEAVPEPQARAFFLDRIRALTLK